MLKFLFIFQIGRVFAYNAVLFSFNSIIYEIKMNTENKNKKIQNLLITFRTHKRN